nr:exosortase A [Belnapia moabensis]
MVSNFSTRSFSGRRSGWGAALLLLGLCLTAFSQLFREEGAAAVQVWNASTAYNHCWLILPISTWLAWSRRHRLAALWPEPSPWLALLALPPAFAWLVAERLGIMEGRQFALIGLIWVLVLAVLGWRIWRAMAAPLFYLVFLVPFGGFATPMLQSITAWMIDHLLDFTSVPHFVDNLIIETPGGLFLVAEACAGLRFLIAAVAFGALYAFEIFRSPKRRLVVMAFALVVPILANGLRAFGIVLLGQYLGSAEAAAADHVVYGWGFFSLVILLLILTGLPFRQDGHPDSQPVATPGAASVVATQRRAVLGGAALLAVGFAAVGPALAGALQQTGSQPPQRLVLPLAPLEGCGLGPAEGSLRCGDVVVTAEAIVFPAQVTWRAVAAERGRIEGHGDQDKTYVVAPQGGIIWRARHSDRSNTTVAVAAALNGRSVGFGLRSRAEQALNSLGLGSGVPVLAAVRVQLAEGAKEVPAAAWQRAALETVLQARTGSLAADIGRLSGAR